MAAGGRAALCGILLIAAFGCGSEQPRASRLAGTEAPADPSDEAPAGDDVLVAEEGGSIGPAAVAATSCTASDLALCFTFDGSTVDQSPSGLAPSEASNVTFVPARDGQGASFGPTSALRFAPNPAFDLPSTAAAIEAWIKRTSTGADAVVFDDDARFSLTIAGAGKVWCKSSKGAVLGSTVLPVDQWVHVACVVDNGTMRAYVGGVVDAIGTGGIDPSPLSTAAIGGNAPSGEPFIGVIDSLRVFRVARTPEEIATAAKR